VAGAGGGAAERLGLTPNLRRITIGAGLRAFGLSLIGPFLALYLHDVLFVGYLEIGLLVAALSIPPLVVTGVGGLVADRLGRRRIFLLAFLLEGSSLVAAGFAMADRSLVGVLASFALVSIAGNLGGPAIAAYVSDFTQGPMRTRAFTWQRVGWNVGFALGVGLGGAFLVLVGFAPVAWGAAASTLVGAAFLAATLEPSPYDLRLAERGLPGSLPVGRPGSVRDSFRLLRRDTPFLLFCLAGALAIVTIGQWNVTFSLYAVGRLGLPYSIVGLGFAANGLVVVFGQVPTTQLSIGRRHTSLAILGTLAYVVAWLALGAAALLPMVAVAVFFAAVIVLTFGENLTSIPSSTLPSNAAPPTEIGAYNGAFLTITGIGGIVSVVVGGLALASIANPVLLWVVLSAPAVPGVILLAAAGRRLRSPANRA
jgi:MFS family permease